MEFEVQKNAFGVMEEMTFNLKNRHFHQLLDFNPKEFEYLLARSGPLKKAISDGRENLVLFRCVTNRSGYIKSITKLWK